jgi:hypothetical protein
MRPEVHATERRNVHDTTEAMSVTELTGSETQQKPRDNATQTNNNEQQQEAEKQNAQSADNSELLCESHRSKSKHKKTKA